MSGYIKCKRTKDLKIVSGDAVYVKVLNQFDYLKYFRNIQVRLPYLSGKHLETIIVKLNEQTGLVTKISNDSQGEFMEIRIDYLTDIEKITATVNIIVDYLVNYEWNILKENKKICETNNEILITLKSNISNYFENDSEFEFKALNLGLSYEESLQKIEKLRYNLLSKFISYTTTCFKGIIKASKSNKFSEEEQIEFYKQAITMSLNLPNFDLISQTHDLKSIEELQNLAKKQLGEEITKYLNQNSQLVSDLGIKKLMEIPIDFSNYRDSFETVVQLFDLVKQVFSNLKGKDRENFISYKHLQKFLNENIFKNPYDERSNISDEDSKLFYKSMLLENIDNFLNEFYEFVITYIYNILYADKLFKLKTTETNVVDFLFDVPKTHKNFSVILKDFIFK